MEQSNPFCRLLTFVFHPQQEWHVFGRCRRPTQGIDMKVLQLDSSILGEASVSRQLTRR